MILNKLTFRPIRYLDLSELVVRVYFQFDCDLTVDEYLE